MRYHPVGTGVSDYALAVATTIVATVPLLVWTGCGCEHCPHPHPLALGPRGVNDDGEGIPTRVARRPLPRPQGQPSHEHAAPGVRAFALA